EAHLDFLPYHRIEIRRPRSFDRHSRRQDNREEDKGRPADADHDRKAGEKSQHQTVVNELWAKPVIAEHNLPPERVYRGTVYGCGKAAPSIHSKKAMPILDIGPLYALYTGPTITPLFILYKGSHKSREA